jgi:type IV fimbrial biogenesis protein FimT
MSSLQNPIKPAAPSRPTPPATRATKLRRAKGISLVECCTVLAVLGVLSTAAVGGSGGLLQRQWDQRLTSLGASQLQAALNLARSEALKTGRRAVVCQSVDGQQCASAGAWSQGWMVFRDANNDAQRDDGEAVVMVTPALAAGLQISGNASIARYVSFQPDGSAATAAGAFQAGTFTICRSGSPEKTGKQIVLSATGRTRQQEASPATCT